jgi:hypothetical protein
MPVRCASLAERNGGDRRGVDWRSVVVSAPPRSSLRTTCRRVRACRRVGTPCFRQRIRSRLRRRRPDVGDAVSNRANPRRCAALIRDEASRATLQAASVEATAVIPSRALSETTPAIWVQQWCCAPKAKVRRVTQNAERSRSSVSERGAVGGRPSSDFEI